MNKNYYIDYKTIVWQRAKFKDKKSLDKAIIASKLGNIADIFDGNFGFIENEILYDTLEDIHVEDNLGNPTIEAYEDQKLIWSNG